MSDSPRGGEAKHYTVLNDTALTTQRIALPPRLQGGAIDRDNLNTCWILWLHTKDWVHGTYLALYDDGRCERITLRADEGPEIWEIKP